MADLQLYREILKFEEQPDGTLMVTGVVTDPTIDSDEQICDAEWLKTAMPDWFQYGNIREQHSSIAAGVATEHTVDGDLHRIVAHVVDPTSCKKVKNRVLKGFSIGIRDVRVVADPVAKGGRIVGGWIPEVSLVDRPANPSAVLELAKAAGGTVLQVENLIEKDGHMDECAKCGKSAELDDDKMCADCKAKAAESAADEAKADDATDESTGGDDAVDEAAGGAAAAGDEGSDDADETDKGEGDDAPDGEDGEDEAAEEATLASIDAKLDKVIDLLSSKAEADKALESRVGKVEKAAARPARTNTSKAAGHGDEATDKLKSERADLVQKATGTNDQLLAKGYRDRIAEIDRELHK